MQLTNLLSIPLLAIIFTASATPLIVEKRDLATFQTAFGNVGAALSTFDTAIKGLTESSDIPSAIATLTDNSNAIVTALNTGGASINATQPLSLLDSLNLLTLSNTLVGTANTTITDLIAKKPIIDTAGQVGLVVTQLQAVKAATNGFIGAVTSQVPSAVQSIASQQAGQVITVINNGITAFGGSVSRFLL